MQQRNEILKYILDIESIISELEKIIEHHNADYNDFLANFISIRAVERDLMIIGEAIGKILRIKEDIKITSAKHIIGLRNMIVHAYDSIDPTALWRILILDLPVLKQEVEFLKSN
jgi:uncharacterized protein with HEPN domain